MKEFGPHGGACKILLCRSFTVHDLSKQGCAHFAELLQNFTESQILWILCLVEFHEFALKLPTQTTFCGVNSKILHI